MLDIRQRFYFQQHPMRGEIVHLNDTLTAIFDRHNYPPLAQRILGELLTASVLLTATLKMEGRLSLQARGDGLLRTMMAECTHQHEVRGIMQLAEDAVWPEEATLSELLGKGILVITLEPDMGERYQGIVPLTGDSVASCIEGYFAQSEQLPTRLWLACDGTQAGGLLLQALPNYDTDPDLWPRLTHLASTLKSEELLQLPPDEILYRLYHEDEVVLPPTELVQFACTCSRERTADALISVGQAEVEDLLAQEGSIRLTCQFCHNEYVFLPEDIRQLFGSALH